MKLVDRIEKLTDFQKTPDHQFPTNFQMSSLGIRVFFWHCFGHRFFDTFGFMLGIVFGYGGYGYGYGMAAYG